MIGRSRPGPSAPAAGEPTGAATSAAIGADGLRIDKLLWFLRLAPDRAGAQRLAAAGCIRLDGRRVDRAAALVRVGAVLTIPGPHGARALRIVRLPVRRMGAALVGEYCIDAMVAAHGSAGHAETPAE